MCEALMASSRRRLLLDTNITSTLAINKADVAYDGDANFDSNMVIILAALLFALLCALGLNSIIRFVLWCTRRYDSHGPTDRAVAADVALDRIKKEAASGIPVVVYKSGLHIPATDCPICLGEFAEGEEVRIFPRCNHGFHVKCIDKWLVSHSSCPTCRQPLIGHSTDADREHTSIQIR